MCYLQLALIMNILKVLLNHHRYVLYFYVLIWPTFEFNCLHVKFIVILFYIYVVSFSSISIEHIHFHKCN